MTAACSGRSCRRAPSRPARTSASRSGSSAPTTTPKAQSQAIEAAIAEGPDGIAISLADPEGVSAAAQAVTDAGIPLYTLNSGLNNYEELGAITHIGQTETVAGEGAGERFNELGATKILCARQEQTNIALEERCEGLATTFEGEVVSEFVGLDADPTEQENQISAILQSDPAIDAVMGTGPNIPLRAIAAGESAGRELIIGGFDISPDVIAAIESGDVAFTVDQQQYLQGYLPIVLMYLQATNLNTAGGGLPILTGPGFVDAENVAGGRRAGGSRHPVTGMRGPRAYRPAVRITTRRTPWPPSSK